MVLNFFRSKVAYAHLMPENVQPDGRESIDYIKLYDEMPEDIKNASEEEQAKYIREELRKQLKKELHNLSDKLDFYETQLDYSERFISNGISFGLGFMLCKVIRILR